MSLNPAISRNIERFPEDFMFQHSNEETELLRFQFETSISGHPENEVLRSQSVTSKENRGGRRYLPYAFTEQGMAMLSGILRSERAVKVNIAIMRAPIDLPPYASVRRSGAAAGKAVRVARVQNCCAECSIVQEEWNLSCFGLQSRVPSVSRQHSLREIGSAVSPGDGSAGAAVAAKGVGWPNRFQEELRAGIRRVCLDITSKPPGTIEWE